VSRSPYLEVRGEAYLSLEAAAQCFEVEVAWVREVYELGLLGEGEDTGAGLAIPAPMLDRLARVVHLAHHLEVELEWVALVLERDASL
jgi:hypothetical protein